MIQLRTPIRFEGSLSALDEPRPLSVSEEVGQRIALAVGNVNPVGAGQVARGKLLRSNQAGGELIEPAATGQNIEIITITWLQATPANQTATFAQRVDRVLLEIVSLGVSNIEWQRPSPTTPLAYWGATGNYWIDFVGTLMYWRHLWSGADAVINLHGFY